MTQPQGSKVFAVYDISSSSVAGAHILRDRGRSVFLASARKETSLQEDINMERFVSETVRTLEEVIATLRKTDVHHPSYIQVALASPWYTAQTRSIVYKKPTAFTCTARLVNELVDTEIQHILAHEQGPFGSFGAQSLIIEKQLSGIRLNGYTTDAPFGKQATVLEFSLAITIAPKPIIDRLKEVFIHAYGTRTVSFTTSLFTTFVVGRACMPDLGDCTVIDVGEEISDVGFVKRGSMVAHHSFPVGTYGLYRALVGSANLSIHESRALLESYRLGKLSAKASKSVESAISTFLSSWQTAFDTVLDTTTGFSMPHTVLLTVDPKFELLLSKVLKSDALLAHSTTTKPKVLVIDADFLGAFTTDKTLDIPLATAATFVDHLV